MATPAGIEIAGLSKSYGPIEAVRGIDVTIAPGETVALLGPNGAGKSTTIDMLLGLLAARRGHGVRVRVAADARRSTAGAVGAMLQTGALIRDLTVRELVAMMASLYPAPLAGRRGARAHRHRRHRRPAHAEALRRPDPARALRRRARRATPTCSCSTSRRWRWTSRAATRSGRRCASSPADGQDGRLRHALPRGGRRLRRPRRADGPRRDRRRRAADRDQGDGRHAHDPRHAARTSRSRRSSALPGVDARRAARRGGRARLHRLRRGDPRAARRATPTPATSRSAAPGSRRRSSSSPAANGGRDVNRAYTRYELLRTFRNRRFFVFSLGVPARPVLPDRRRRTATRRPRRHRALGAALLHGRPGRLRHDERDARRPARASPASARSGWNRQLRITPLSARAYFRAKVVTGYLMAGAHARGARTLAGVIARRQPRRLASGCG